MKKKWLVLAAAAIFGSTFAAAPAQSIEATSYKPYSYWIKKDLRGFKPHSVVLTKDITIRKIVWHKNSISHYLGKRKTLKKGTSIKIMANKQSGYYWALFGKYSNWVYPHKTANWFKKYSKKSLAKYKPGLTNNSKTNNSAKDKKASYKEKMALDKAISSAEKVKSVGTRYVLAAEQKRDDFDLKLKDANSSFKNSKATSSEVAKVISDLQKATDALDGQSVNLPCSWEDYSIKRTYQLTDADKSAIIAACNKCYGCTDAAFAPGSGNYLNYTDKTGARKEIDVGHFISFAK